MEIFKSPKFDFMKYRKAWVAISFATIAFGLVAMFLGKLNFGIDFVGGTQLTIKFRDAADVEELRNLIAGAGFREAVIQDFGEKGEHEVIIRTPIVEGSEEGSGARVLEALRGRYSPAANELDLNKVDAIVVSRALAQSNPDGVAPVAAEAHYLAGAGKLLERRKLLGMFRSWDDVGTVDGLSAAARADLQARATLGGFAVLGVENVGPQVGSELRQQGIFAVVGAMIGMLLYIWIRFELRFGVGATMATIHDVLITLGLFAWAGYEFNLTTVAAFLTLIGYSVNDTVVTFDRVRENLRKNRSGDLMALLNKSINQTLSRTLLTGGTTILVSLCLFFFGGDVIRGFAFVMTVGVVVGTYSSIYIASPFALLWEQWFGANGRFRRNEPTKPAAAR